MSTTFNESKHPRRTDGKFTHKTYAEADDVDIPSAEPSRMLTTAKPALIEARAVRAENTFINSGRTPADKQRFDEANLNRAINGDVNEALSAYQRVGVDVNPDAYRAHVEKVKGVRAEAHRLGYGHNPQPVPSSRIAEKLNGEDVRLVNMEFDTLTTTGCMVTRGDGDEVEVYDPVDETALTIRLDDGRVYEDSSGAFIVTDSGDNPRFIIAP